MAENQKYFYLKLKDNFFDTDEMVVLESMPDGYLYSNILLKLYLRSLKYSGRLMFNDRIPFSSTMLAQVTRHNVGVVEKAMQIFQELGLVEILDNGAIYMIDIQNFIGKSTTEADRIREYRQKIEREKTCTNVQLLNDKNTPELELELKQEKELELEKKIEKEKPPKPPKHKYGEYNNVFLTDEEVQRLQAEFSADWHERIERLSGYIASTGKSYKSHFATIRNWARKEAKEPKEAKKTTGNPFLDMLARSEAEGVDPF